jgi:hypothetical protein
MSHTVFRICTVSFLVALLYGCAQKDIRKLPERIEQNCGTAGALSTCLTPKFDSAYYVEQGIKYFLTMQSDIPNDVIPNYAPLVVRWEWPPWLLLTGYGKEFLIASDILLKLYPTRYYKLDCRYFEEQPFCRCHVIFDYSGDSCPIYEEFTFNDQGEITFIEAWSDFESTLPLNMNSGSDSTWSEAEYWATQEDVKRLSTKVPGLGNTTGRIDIKSSWMEDAAAIDEDVSDLVRRIKDPVRTYLQQLAAHREELDKGCKAPAGDRYPYYTP